MKNSSTNRTFNNSLLITCLALITFSSLANTTKKEFDLNKDGLTDRLEFYQGSKLIRLEEDRNFDQKFDYRETHDLGEYFLITEQDTNFDSKFDYKKSFSVYDAKKSKVSIEIDKDFDGNYEILFFEVINNLQDNTECFQVAIQSHLDKLSATSLAIGEKINGQFHKTGTGFKIEQDCFNKWGDGFKDVVKESVSTGLQCLSRLAKKNKQKMTGALKNGFDLTQLFKDDKISLVCSETGYDWEGTRAHASTKKGQKMETKNIHHPFVSLNPKFPENKVQNRKDELKQIKETIFHEALHNLGFRHSEDIEFSYGCGACCFDNTEAGNGKDIACKICLGDYKNEMDPNYLSDFVDFGKENYKESFARDAVIKYSKSSPKDLKILSMMADSSASIFNPIGSKLAKLIEKNHPQNLDQKMKSHLASATKYADLEEYKSSPVSNSTLAQTYYELYYNHDGAKAVDLLSKNKDALKKEIKALKAKGGDYAWIADNLSESIDGLIYEMWINKFPSKKATTKETSTKAYELHLFFKESK